MFLKHTFLLLMSVWLVSGQRPSFAGSKPIGFPEVITTPDPLGNRFGDNKNEAPPYEGEANRELLERLSKLPIDKQPFWFINWKAQQENLKNPQTYPQRPSSFLDPNQNSGANTNTAVNSGKKVQRNTGSVQQNWRSRHRV